MGACPAVRDEQEQPLEWEGTRGLGQLFPHGSCAGAEVRVGARNGVLRGAGVWMTQAVMVPRT
ncbi:hypothetical protein STENM327S_07720 [Streptomyces tendae]